MKVIGIVCEYNPFHLSHAQMLENVREKVGDDCAFVCAMSGNFVQRGEPAIFNKYARAKAAVLGGADLVLELPTLWSIASAERFAWGGISLLRSTGLCTHLAFGSESCDVEVMRQTAQCVKTPEFDAELKRQLSSGVSFARARQNAVQTLTGRFLPGANDILGVEYMKAMDALSFSPQVITVPRTAEHDGAINGNLASASALRELLRSGGDISPYVPGECGKSLFEEIRSGRAVTDMRPFENAILYRLRTMSESDYAALADGSEGLYLRLMKNARALTSVNEIIEATKTKRYTMARIRRMVLSAFLGITAGDSSGAVPYAHVLAFSPRGQELLSLMRKTCSVPVITKPARAKRLPGRAGEVFRREAGFYDIYTLGYKNQSEKQGGAEWRSGPWKKELT